MAAAPQNSTKMLSAQLRNKANEFLRSKKHANNLAEILEMFDTKTDNHTPLLLTIEMIFVELLKRNEMVLPIIQPLKPTDKSPRTLHKEWLIKCYETATARVLECIIHGSTASRIQALVTAFKLLQAEGQYPMDCPSGFTFPLSRLKNIFIVLLQSELTMSDYIARFQEFAEYRDVQQYGLKVLSSIPHRRSPTLVYMQNYLELLDKLLTCELTIETTNNYSRDYEGKEETVLCGAIGQPDFPYKVGMCRRYANKCWTSACQWPLCSEPRMHRRALVLLVERMLPILSKPKLATDILCDSLDAGGPISMLALQGVLELIRSHNVNYPDVYDRLYAMYEPEMFAMRYKQRLIHITDIFLSSTHLTESLVAAFAKRLTRLSLVAPPEDAVALLQLVINLIHRHPDLKRMICMDDTHHIISNDPYVMEETCCERSRAVGSSLWELAALKRHYYPALATAATALLGAPHAAHLLKVVDLKETRAFDLDVKRKFKAIQMHFTRPLGMIAASREVNTRRWEYTV